MAETEYVFGHIPGQPVGSLYANRTECMKARVHQIAQLGIAGNAKVGAVSIVVSGGYEDDEDFGDWIVYTGAGGNDASSKQQVADQDINYFPNAAMVVSQAHALPVRVVRGSGGDPKYSPPSGFRYDGLFRVDSYGMETGKRGFQVCRFTLSKLEPAETPASFDANSILAGPPSGTSMPGRKSGVTQRIVRSTVVAGWVKRLHAYRCQVCGVKLSIPVSEYAEGAHIQALGSPHNGPDTVDNILCLCPNDHVLFDMGAIYIGDDLVVRQHDGIIVGHLRTHPEHPIALKCIEHHRKRFGF